MRRLASGSLLALSLLTSGCSAAMLAHVSAEPTGCAEEQLEITDQHQPWQGPSSWTATCRAPNAEPSVWFCSRAGDAQQVICSDVPAQAPDAG